MITLDNINKVLRLDAATGKLFWKVGGRHGRLSGQEAGGMDAQGYRRLRFGRLFIMSHHAAYAIANGRMPTIGKEIDHIDGDKLNNRPCNLREVTHGQNQQNARAPKTNTSGFKGVSWHKRIGKWGVNIGVGGRRIACGYFDDVHSAAAAYAAAARIHHGDFARLT